MLGFAELVRTILQSDPVLTALVPGGVWDRVIRPDGIASTPGAYTTVPGGSAKRLQTAIAVLDREEVVAPLGEAVGGTWAYCAVQIHLPRSNQDTLSDIDQQVRALFARRHHELPSGLWALTTALSRSRLLDDEANPGAVYTVRELRADTATGATVTPVAMPAPNAA